MKIINWMAGLLAASVLLGGIAGAQELVPAARSRVDDKNRVTFSRGIVVDDDLRPQAEAFADGLRRLGGGEVDFLERPVAGSVRFDLGKQPGSSTYRIRVREGTVRVEAENGVGAAQAAATLLQLASIDGSEVSWPVTDIQDGPDLEFRSFLVDMGRNPHGPDTLRAVVDMCWFYYPRTMFTAVSVECCYEWDRRVFRHVNPAIPTFAKPHRVDSGKGILGFCMPWWEGREQNLIPLCLPRLAAVSCAAWNREGEDDFASFQRRNEVVMARLREMIGIPAEPMPVAPEVTPEGNLAFGRPVLVSTGASQPPFGPTRLTNGLTDRFDHFLGYPTEPEPLEIVIELGEATEISRVVVYETAVGKSYEQYRVEVSKDGKRFVQVGEAGKGTRGESDHVVHEFPSQVASHVRIVTDGCKDFVFSSFSRLTEVQAFAED